MINIFTTTLNSSILVEFINRYTASPKFSHTIKFYIQALNNIIILKSRSKCYETQVTIETLHLGPIWNTKIRNRGIKANIEK